MFRGGYSEASTVDLGLDKIVGIDRVDEATTHPEYTDDPMFWDPVSFCALPSALCALRPVGVRCRHCHLQCSTTCMYNARRFIPTPPIRLPEFIHMEPPSIITGGTGER